MVRRTNIQFWSVWLIVLCLLSLPMSCQSVVKWEQSGKTDQVCSYFQLFFNGAQAFVGVFGPMAGQAQIIITTGQSITTALCKASDDYTANSLQQQAYDQARQLVDLGSQAGIK